jgi:hypothetical protein
MKTRKIVAGLLISLAMSGVYGGVSFAETALAASVHKAANAKATDRKSVKAKVPEAKKVVKKKKSRSVKKSKSAKTAAKTETKKAYESVK